MLATCHGNIQSDFKIDLGLTMFTFHIENHESFWPLKKELPKAGQE